MISQALYHDIVFLSENFQWNRCLHAKTVEMFDKRKYLAIVSNRLKNLPQAERERPTLLHTLPFYIRRLIAWGPCPDCLASHLPAHTVDVVHEGTDVICWWDVRRCLQPSSSGFRDQESADRQWLLRPINGCFCFLNAGYGWDTCWSFTGNITACPSGLVSAER